jgi:hypothetical protein
MTQNLTDLRKRLDEANTPVTFERVAEFLTSRFGDSIDVIPGIEIRVPSPMDQSYINVSVTGNGLIDARFIVMPDEDDEDYEPQTIRPQRFRTIEQLSTWLDKEGFR